METESAGFAPPLHFGGYAAFGFVEITFVLDLFTRYSSQLFYIDLNQIKQKANGDRLSGHISNVAQLDGF